MWRWRVKVGYVGGGVVVVQVGQVDEVGGVWW